MRCLDKYGPDFKIQNKLSNYEKNIVYINTNLI